MKIKLYSFVKGLRNMSGVGNQKRMSRLNVNKGLVSAGNVERVWSKSMGKIQQSKHKIL